MKWGSSWRESHATQRCLPMPRVGLFDALKSKVVIRLTNDSEICDRVRFPPFIEAWPAYDPIRDTKGNEPLSNSRV